MRCYLLSNGRIKARVHMADITDDTEAIRFALGEFKRKRNSFNPRLNGFEVWHGARFIYRWPSPRSLCAAATSRTRRPQA